MGLLERKTAVITGGGTGIGQAIAERFHQEGATVILCGRRFEKLIEAAKKISQIGERVYTIQADITLDRDIKTIIEGTVRKTGRIDILVNNAGLMRSGTRHLATNRPSS